MTDPTANRLGSAALGNQAPVTGENLPVTSQEWGGLYTAVDGLVGETKMSFRELGQTNTPTDNITERGNVITHRFMPPEATLEEGVAVEDSVAMVERTVSLGSITHRSPNDPTKPTVRLDLRHGGVWVGSATKGDTSRPLTSRQAFGYATKIVGDVSTAIVQKKAESEKSRTVAADEVTDAELDEMLGL